MSNVIYLNKIKEINDFPVAYCAACGERVDEKGKIDIYFPFYSTHNRCSKCIHIIRVNPRGYSDD